MYLFFEYFVFVAGSIELYGENGRFAVLSNSFERGF
jgi:hypothetical protein